MIIYHGTYNGRYAPALGTAGLAQAPAAVPAVPPAPPTPAPAPVLVPVSEPSPAAATAAAATVTIGGVKVRVWNIALAGGIVLGTVAIIGASVAAMRTR